MKPIIRTANLQDIEMINNLQQMLVEFERPFDKGIPKNGEVHYYNLKGLITDNKAHFIVAEINDKIIGCGFGQIKKNVDWAVNDTYGMIGLMIVHEDYRDQKIGKEILNKIINWFKEKNIFDIRLEVFEENSNAIEAYKKCGFKEFTKIMQYKEEK